jgi:hypothetical protein
MFCACVRQQQHQCCPNQTQTLSAAEECAQANHTPKFANAHEAYKRKLRVKVVLTSFDIRAPIEFR